MKDLSKIWLAMLNHSVDYIGERVTVNLNRSSYTRAVKALDITLSKSSDPRLAGVVGSVLFGQMVEHSDEHLDVLFHALANDTRRKIVNLLSKRPYNVSELVPRFAMSLAAVSKHVKILERAGLINRQVVGRNHLCSLNADALSSAYIWLGAYESFWQQRLDVLERVLRETEVKHHGPRKR